MILGLLQKPFSNLTSHKPHKQQHREATKVALYPPLAEPYKIYFYDTTDKRTGEKKGRKRNNAWE